MRTTFPPHLIVTFRFKGTQCGSFIFVAIFTIAVDRKEQPSLCVKALKAYTESGGAVL